MGFKPHRPRVPSIYFFARRQRASRPVAGAMRQTCSCQPVLSAGFPRFHGEFVHPLRVVGDVFAAAETINRQPDGFVQ